MSTTMLNHRRPSLNDQINRLDAILDGLAEGLNDAVATAVTEAVIKATETVLREILQRPDLWRAAATSTASVVVASTPRTPLWRRVWTGVTWLMAATRRSIGNGVSSVRRTVLALPKTTASRVVRLTMAAACLGLLVWRARRSVPLAVSIGISAAALAYLGTPEISAALQGLNAVALAFLARWVITPQRARVAA